MKRILLSIMIMLAAVPFALGQTAEDVKTAEPSRLEQDLIKLKHNIGRAYVEKDVAALECLYADEYT
ncbi:hypothetical protein, partial [Listeria monocytogenes]|uniref:hypothetical protein n=1 Tax=Listeria monocytogenes TaxID=1639 RepID=UPI001125AFBA